MPEENKDESSTVEVNISVTNGNQLAIGSNIGKLDTILLLVQVAQQLIIEINDDFQEVDVNVEEGAIE